MSSKAFKPPSPAGCDQDFVAWTEETARLLPERRFEELDVEHIAAEIEDRGKSDRRQLQSRLTVLLSHLLKWRFQPAQRARSWRLTAAVQRMKLKALFRDSPSLQAALPRWIEETCADAVTRAAMEAGLSRKAFPPRCPFSPDQILDPDYLPD